MALRGSGGLPQGPEEGQEGPDQGELDLDRVRHVDPGQDLGPYPQAVQVFGGPGSEDGSSSHWTASTTRSSGGSVVSDRGAEDRERGEQPADPSVDSFERQPSVRGEVRYRAEDEALMVVYGDDELRVPLPGWSLEEVHSIVVSIQEGDWSYFREALNISGSSGIGVEVRPRAQGSPMWQVPPNGVFIGPLEGSEGDEGTPQFEDEEAHFTGSAVSSELPELESLDQPGVDSQGEWTFTAISEVVDHIGIVSWVVWACCSLVGAFTLLGWLYEGWRFMLMVEVEQVDEGACPASKQGSRNGTTRPPGEALSWGSALLGVWLASVMQRVGVVLLGTTVHPRCVVLCLPGSQVSVIPAFERPEWALWLLLMLLMGLCGSAEAQRLEVPEEAIRPGLDLYAAPVVRWSEDTTCVASRPPKVGMGMNVVVAGLFMLFTIILWESGKWVLCSRRNFRRTAESQTEGMNIVPMPLPEGMPFCARILFAFWKAGYDVDLRNYPEAVCEEFHSLVGMSMKKGLMDEDSSD